MIQERRCAKYGKIRLLWAARHIMGVWYDTIAETVFKHSREERERSLKSLFCDRHTHIYIYITVATENNIYTFPEFFLPLTFLFYCWTTYTSLTMDWWWRSRDTRKNSHQDRYNMYTYWKVVHPIVDVVVVGYCYFSRVSYRTSIAKKIYNCSCTYAVYIYIYIQYAFNKKLNIFIS